MPAGWTPVSHGVHTHDEVQVPPELVVELVLVPVVEPVVMPPPPVVLVVLFPPVAPLLAVLPPVPVEPGPQMPFSHVVAVVDDVDSVLPHLVSARDPAIPRLATTKRRAFDGMKGLRRGTLRLPGAAPEAAARR
jgi:hypothetical protein